MGFLVTREAALKKALLELLPSPSYKFKGILNNNKDFFFSGREPQALKPILMLKVTRLHIIPAVTWKGFSACSEGKRKERVKKKKPKTAQAPNLQNVKQLKLRKALSSKSSKTWDLQA